MKINKILTSLAALAGLSFGAAQAAPVNLVLNGGFELTTNGVGNLSNHTTATNWTTTGYNFLYAAGTADTTGTYGGMTLWGPHNGSANGFTDSPTKGNFLAADGA